MNVVTWLFLEIFSGVHLLIRNIKLYTSVNLWHLNVIDLVEKQCKIYRPEHIFKKNSRDQVDQIVDQFHLSKCIPNVSFKFISGHEICKKYVLMSISNFHIRTCFKFKI